VNAGNRPGRLAAASITAVCAACLLQGFIRRPGWRGSLAWVLHSWWRPADRDAHWQQAIGEAVDPWDKLLRGSGAGGRGSPSAKSQPPSSVGR